MTRFIKPIMDLSGKPVVESEVTADDGVKRRLFRFSKVTGYSSGQGRIPEEGLEESTETLH